MHALTALTQVFYIFTVDVRSLSDRKMERLNLAAPSVQDAKEWLTLLGARQQDATRQSLALLKEVPNDMTGLEEIDDNEESEDEEIEMH